MRCLAACLLLLATAVAHAQPADDAAPKLVVGVYAPDVLFASALARTSFAQQIATQLSSKTGLTLVGRGFATQDDFVQQVNQGRVQFAVVSAQFLARQGYPAFAQGQASGKATRAMVLVTKGPGSIGGLKGKTLAGVDGAQKAFVMNYLLQGQVPGDWFSFKAARDTQAALGMVKLGRAQGAFTFSGNTAGLNVAFTSRPAPLPLFVQTDKSLDASAVAKVRSAIGGVRVKSSAFSSFGAVDAAGLAAVRAASKGGLRSPGTAPVLAPARAALPPVPEFVERGPPPVVLSKPSSDLTAPAAPEDAF